ncbi:MAG: glycosyltransferase family 2 protein [Flavobacteriales bacterium]|nr:glycosyltransferase family 2 protein [Flavobacteriales bacterium]MDW8410220.1 glycosyltransferase [Flavobacteriales bacterium]
MPHHSACFLMVTEQSVSNHKLSNPNTEVVLSVVVVSYNVRYFLEQCLWSIDRALRRFPKDAVEVFVVDNHSTDDSVAMVETRFPWCKLIKNGENLGFSRANNQAIRMARGRYVLLLNPDTLIPENALQDICAFMDKHPEAGALGVRMIDGAGKFLPESKRGLPTLWVAFTKIFGFASLFPRSRLFGQYHLRYLDEKSIHQVEVLSGAFMLMRKSVLDKVGLLDERFFMYGEDVDLSYRITQAGYFNYYFPHVTIVHYKGESTRKASLKYVKVFYQAMVLFADKHFTGPGKKVLRLLVRMAVGLRASLAVVRRAWNWLALPSADFVLSYTLLLKLTHWWAVQMKDLPEYYPARFTQYVLPAYVGVWMLSAAISGAYQRPYRTLSLLRGLLIGTLTILIIYALLPEHWRFSRAITVAGAVATGAVFVLNRFWWQYLTGGQEHENGLEPKRTVLVTKGKDGTRIRQILSASTNNLKVVGEVVLSATMEPAAATYLRQAMRLFEAEAIVFSGAELPAALIINLMDALSSEGWAYHVALEGCDCIIGSHSAQHRGEYFAPEVNALADIHKRRQKRMCDVGLSIVILLLMPYLVLRGAIARKVVFQVVEVLKGKRTWVAPRLLPPIPGLSVGILAPWQQAAGNPASTPFLKDVELLYLKEYSWTKDVLVVMRNLREIGKEHVS